MRFDFDEFKKAWENPMTNEYAKTARKNLTEGITKASDYHTQMVKGSVDAMVRMHEWWLKSVDWYIDSHKKMTNYVTERLNGKETTTDTNN